MTGSPPDAPTMNRPEASDHEYTYDVFISYSRTDAPFVRKLARALDRYRPPKGIGLPARTLRVFRDEGDLTGSDYYASIDRHLTQARTLIVVCSPAARHSQYVNDEIRRFGTKNGADRIIPLLVDGIPNNEAGPEDEDRKAFPEALYAFMELPLATSYLDFDERRDSPARGQFQAAWYTLLANVCGVSRRRIEQRDVKRRRRQRTVALATTATIMSALIALTTFATVQRGLAETRRAQAEELIDFMLTDLREKLLPIGRLELLDDVGDQALRYFAALPEEEFSDEELLARSQALYQIGEVRLNQGDFAEALGPFTESLRLARELTLRSPLDPDRLFGQSQSHFWVGYAAWLQRDLAAAEAEFQEYMRIARTLVAMDSTNATWQIELAYAHSNLGSVREERRDLEGARASFESNLAIMGRIAAETPDDAAMQSELATAHNKLAVVLEKLGDLPGAVAQYEANLTITRALVDADSTNAVSREDMGLSYLFLGDVRRLLGDEERARESYLAYEGVYERLVLLDGENIEWALSLAHAQRKVALALLDGGDLTGAEARLTAALTAFEEMAEREPDRFEFPKESGRSRWTLGLVRREQGRLDDAVTEARASVELFESILAHGGDFPEVDLWIGESRLLEGDVLSRGDLESEAREAWELALARTDDQTGQADVLDLRARALARLDRTEEARTILADLLARGYRSPPLEALAEKLGLRP